MKHCLYCLRPFSGRGRCCSEWCARKVNGKAAWVSRSRSIARTRELDAQQRRARHVPKFRQLAMSGFDPSLVEAIFGTTPSLSPPRHGETIEV